MMASNHLILCRPLLFLPSIFPNINESESHSVMSDSLRPHGLYSPWNPPGQNTGVGRLSLLQRIFPTQESNRGLLPCRQILYQLSYQGSSENKTATPLFLQKKYKIKYTNKQENEWLKNKTEANISWPICFESICVYSVPLQNKTYGDNMSPF